jgi:hypothetical protein
MQARVFVHNVTVQVIERGYMRGLPKIFASRHVFRMGDETVRVIASETPETRERRMRLKEQVEGLQESLVRFRDITSTIDKSKVCTSISLAITKIAVTYGKTLFD